MAKQRYPPQVREFRCESCGLEVQATKRPDRRTGPGHIKHMWCIKCRDFTRHVQISEAK